MIEMIAIWEGDLFQLRILLQSLYEKWVAHEMERLPFFPVIGNSGIIIISGFCN